MKKWTLALMLLAMLAVPALACGFPLPAGTTTMAVTKAVCAEGEAADSCQMRQDAYQMMSTLQSAAITGMTMNLVVDDGASLTSATISGSFEYVTAESTEGLGANLNARLEDGELTSEGTTETLDGWEFVIVGNKGYTSRDGGETWTYEELDESALMGIGLLLGLGGPAGTAVDLFVDPAIFTVTVGADVEMGGQTMHVQTLTVDLVKLLGSTSALSTLFDSAGTVSGGQLDTASLGLDPSQVAMMSMMLLPAFEGSELSTTIYIGADDGLIHRVEDKYLLNMDLSAFDPTMKPMVMSYELSGDLEQHNAALTITAPEGATEGAGLLDEGGLFGSGGGLGDSLFGTSTE